MLKKLFVSLTLCSLAALPNLTAQTVTLEYEDPAIAGVNQRSISEDGFTTTSLTTFDSTEFLFPNLTEFQFPNTASGNHALSAYDEGILIEATDNTPFDALQIDLGNSSSLYYSNTEIISFIGTKVDGTLVTTTFSLSPTDPRIFQTFIFPASLSNIISLQYSGPLNSTFEFDNVRLRKAGAEIYSPDSEPFQDAVVDVSATTAGNQLSLASFRGSLLTAINNGEGAIIDFESFPSVSSNRIEAPVSGTSSTLTAAFPTGSVVRTAAGALASDSPPSGTFGIAPTGGNFNLSPEFSTPSQAPGQASKVGFILLGDSASDATNGGVTATFSGGGQLTLNSALPFRADGEHIFYGFEAPAGEVIDRIETSLGGTQPVILDEFAAILGVEEVNAHILNLSARGFVGTGDDVLIAGVIVQGTGSKTLLFTGRGPSVAVDGNLPNPQLSLHDSSGAVIASSNDWASEPSAAAITGYGVGIPGDPLDAAVQVTVPPGAYTAILSGVNGQTGIGIVEVFDLDPNQPAFLKNLSARGPVRNGDHALIGGIVIGGNTGNKTLILRARGPSLPNTLNRANDPTFTIFNGAGVSQATYDDWTLDPGAAQFLSGSYTSFAPINGFEAATVRTLPLGGHTLIVTPKTNEGIGIVEFFATD